jgi:hypothetical protein
MGHYFLDKHNIFLRYCVVFIYRYQMTSLVKMCSTFTSHSIRQSGIIRYHFLLVTSYISHTLSHSFRNNMQNYQTPVFSLLLQCSLKNPVYVDHLGVILLILNSNRITILIITELLHTLY